MKGMFGIEGTRPAGGVIRGRMSRAFSAINGLGHEPRPLAWAGMNDAFGVSNAAREAVSTPSQKLGLRGGRPWFQANGLSHTSPGQRPGFIVTFCRCRPTACLIRRLLHRVESVGGFGALHRPPGGASPHTDFPGRVS